MFFMLSREPVAAGFVGLDALVFAVLGVLQVFGVVGLSAEQNAAVIGLVVVASAFFGGLIRSRVVPLEKFDFFAVEAADYADEAYLAGFDLGLFTPVPDGFDGAAGS